jgi:hypothetical protein
MTRDAAKSASKIVAAANNTNFNLSKFRVGQQFVTRLLLFLTISFIFSTLPSTVLYAFWHSEVIKQAHGRIILNLLNTLQFFRHSSNWIIYVYSSSFMREEMKKCAACAETEYELAAQAAALAANQRRPPTVQLLRQLEKLNQQSPHDGMASSFNNDNDNTNVSQNENYYDEDFEDSNTDSGNLNTSAIMNNPNFLNSMLCNDPDLYYYYLYYYGKQQNRVLVTAAAAQKNRLKSMKTGKVNREKNEEEEEEAEDRSGDDFVPSEDGLKSKRLSIPAQNQKNRGVNATKK